MCSTGIFGTCDLQDLVTLDEMMMYWNTGSVWLMYMLADGKPYV